MLQCTALEAVNPSTRFARCSRAQALRILVLAVALTGWCLWVAFNQETVPRPHPRPPPGLGEDGGASTPAGGDAASAPGDAEFYRTMVQRVHAGDNYYDAVALELHKRGYPPRSMFNWRPPFYAWVFGKLPSPVWGQLILIAGALATMTLAYRGVRREAGSARAAAVSLLLLGPFAWCFFPDVCLFTELWSGMLIALSVGAYALDRWRLGMAAGLCALLFRELALPYCLIAVGLAVRQKRRGELVWWLGGLAMYASFLVLHGMEAARRITAGDGLEATNWVQFGGTAFVLLTTQINYFLIQLPAWVAAVYLSGALLGLAAARGPIAARAGLTATAFVAAFSVIGIKPHNGYWGLMYAPLLPFGLVWAPAALRDLYNAMRQRERCGAVHGPG